MPRDLTSVTPSASEVLHLAWQAECLPPSCRPSLDRLVQTLLLTDRAASGSAAGVRAMSRHLRSRLTALSRGN